MYNIIKRNYINGVYNDTHLDIFLKAGYITKEEYDEIIS